MKALLQIDRVENCMEWLETNADKYESLQSTQVLIEDIGTLVKSMAFVNGQMAVAKKELNQAKTDAYHALIASQRGAGFEISPMLAKDYIASRLDNQQYNFDICERCSRTIYHTIEALRSCLSALKMEIQVNNAVQIT